MRYRFRTLLILQLLLAVYWSAYVASVVPKFIATPNGQQRGSAVQLDYRWG